jgi:NADH dehydrogenase
MNTPQILIIGAGFGGVFAAKKLAILFGKNAQITLVNKTPHFEYHAQLYKVLNEGSPLQACIPLRDIFEDTGVNGIEDEIISFDTKKKIAYGKENATYHFDYAIIGIGSENSYYGIPGLSKFSYSFRSINEALRLSRHIHELIEEQAQNPNPIKGSIELVIVGGGPNGVEIAGELAEHSALVALAHHLDPKIIHIKLVEAMDHIMPMLSTQEAKKIRTRLQSLGVRVLEKTTIKESTPTGLITDNGEIKSSTVIWVAGAKAHHLYTEWGFPLEKNGRVHINAYLQPLYQTEIQSCARAESETPYTFIVGDGCQAPGSGQAWPALIQGETAAQNIYNLLTNQQLQPYQPPESMMFLPIGYDWGMALIKNKTYWGSIASLLRQVHNIKFYFKLLPFNKAWEAIKSGGEMCYACETCMHNEKQKI